MKTLPTQFDTDNLGVTVATPTCCTCSCCCSCCVGTAIVVATSMKAIDKVAQSPESIIYGATKGYIAVMAVLAAVLGSNALIGSGLIDFGDNFLLKIMTIIGSMLILTYLIFFLFISKKYSRAARVRLALSLTLVTSVLLTVEIISGPFVLYPFSDGYGRIVMSMGGVMLFGIILSFYLPVIVGLAIGCLAAMKKVVRDIQKKK